MLRVARRSLNYAANKESFIPKEGKYPLGFTVNAVASGVKKDKELDLSLITSPKFPMTTAGVFTTNKFAAAPVLISKNQIQLPNHQVLINSGCANACTGKEGYDNALQIIQAVDSIFAPGTIVMSTGVIGQHLQVPKLKSGIAELEKTLGNTHHDWMRVAEGIMTTDTFPKLISTEFTGPSGTFRMVGIAKGAGMIHPNMATMLAGIFTDAVVSKPNLDAVTRSVVESSFNAISVDGDTSTNDTFIVCANGASGTEVPIVEFQARLEKFAIDLAKLIVYDGEGATKFVDVRVEVKWFNYREQTLLRMQRKFVELFVNRRLSRRHYMAKTQTGVE